MNRERLATLATSCGRSFCAVGVAVSLTALVVAAGCKKQQVQAAGAQPVEVGVVTVQPADVPVTYEFIGQTEPYRSVEIRARVQGFLLKRHFEEGGKVKEGDVLYTIDPREFEANLQNYQARLANAEAQAARWDREVKRLIPMVAEKSASQKEVDDAQSNLDSYSAEARTQKANIARAELDLSYATIKSPLTGKISRSQKDDGSLVDAGANSMLTTVTQVDPIYAYFTISERDLLGVRGDQASGKLRMPARDQWEVGITLLDGSRYGQTGKLDFADVQIDPGTGTAVVRAELPNPDDKLTPGQFVKVQLIGAARIQAMSVPQRAVQQSPGGSFVYTVTPDGKVEVRKVKVGAWQGGEWVIDEGLKPGDRIIVDGAQRVQPGLTVQVASADAAAPSTQQVGTGG